MIEVPLTENLDEAGEAARWFEKRLKTMGAVPRHSVDGVSGSVEASARVFTLPDGSSVEMWSDNFTALSLRGDEATVKELTTQYREAQANG